MQYASPIMYPLRSGAEVLFVEEKLKEFRAQLADEPVQGATDTGAYRFTPVPSKEDWNRMPEPQKLTMIVANWDLEGLRDIKPWVLGNATVAAAMDMCADNPGEWVTFKAASAEAGLGYYQARGQMQALTKKRNLMGKGTWPMLADANPPGGIGLAYKMPPAVAALWKRVRSEP